MAAPMEISSESCSSEDEEESAKLKEAVFGFGIEEHAQTRTDFSQKNEKERIPSKRPDKEIPDADQFENAYNTTPGFRKHVSRKLSEALDSVIDSSGQYFCKGGDNTEESSGVKLFSSSKLALKIDSPMRESGKPVYKRRLPSSSDSSSEDERLAEASVSHDFVLQQSNLPYLTNQKAADIIINQADQPNVTFRINNQVGSSKSEIKTKHTDNGTEIKKDLVNEMDKVSDKSTKKHKKKKKKKHKKGMD